ncbi:uncharacterized protein [Ovis canadensis]|uniref:uncharacterized protein n=1 Tax=Ovis canadensis TaxID=37174 RepID=UPI0038B68466
MVVQQVVAILVLSQEEMSTYPSTPPSSGVSAAAIFPADITAGPSRSGTVSPALTATEEHDWIPGGLDRAGGGAGRDPSPLGVPAPAWEGTDGVEEAAVLLPSLRVPGALRRGHGGPQATVEEECDIEPLEEEESEFELEDLGEEEHLEDTEYLLDEVEEEETLVDEESEQGGAAVVAGDGDPLEQFVSVFWALVHSLLHSFSYDDHGLIWPLAPARWSGTAPGLPQALQSVLRLRRSRKT